MQPKESKYSIEDDGYEISYSEDPKKMSEVMEKKIANVERGLSGVDGMMKCLIISNICFFLILVIVIFCAPFATATKLLAGNTTGVPIG